MAGRTYLAADARRSQILKAARAVFARESRDAASVERLCEAAGIARGTLYHYFDGSPALYVALLDGIAAQLEQVIAQRPRFFRALGRNELSGETAERLTREYMRACLRVLFADDESLRIVLRARGFSDAVDERVQRIADIAIAALEEDIREAQKAGILRPCNAEQTARYLFGGMEGMVMAAIRKNEPLDAESMIDTALTIQLRGLLA